MIAKPINPFSKALLDYHAGDTTATFVIQRDDGFQDRVPAAVFFSDSFPPLESRALSLCEGRVLDIGAAAGRHSLQLVQGDFQVTSLDILPEMKSILHDRGILEIIISDIFTYSGGCFDTLLMLMNGIGMVGTLEKLDQFLQHAHDITSPSGQILCDSIDVSVTTDPVHCAYRRRNLDHGWEPGHQTLTISYQGVSSKPFDWLHIDFHALADHCLRTGWHPDLIDSEPSGHYLCKLTKVNRKEVESETR